jgi:hypothetical protein
MATEKKKSKKGFSGLPIYDIIGKPLIAIARAQSMMAREQLKMILDRCFRFTGEAYEPIMLKMILTRTVLEPAQVPGGTPHLTHVTTSFYLPLITIFPINTLGIENADIDFSVEVTSQYSTESEQADISDPENHWATGTGRVEMMGRISPSTNRASEQESARSHENDQMASFHINVEAGALPLTKGLLQIIDIYTNSIQLSDPQEKNNIHQN